MCGDGETAIAGPPAGQRVGLAACGEPNTTMIMPQTSAMAAMMKYRIVCLLRCPTNASPSSPAATFMEAKAISTRMAAPAMTMAPKIRLACKFSLLTPEEQR